MSKKYFVFVNEELNDKHGTRESAEEHITDLMELDRIDAEDIMLIVDAKNIMLIYGEEIEFKLRAFIPEPASK